MTVKAQDGVEDVYRTPGEDKLTAPFDLTAIVDERLGAVHPDAGSDHRAEPTIAPDHGAQPRITRPTAAIYRLDRSNRYRSADDPYLETLTDAYEQKQAEADHLVRERRIAEERRVARWLEGAIRRHAPKLAWRREIDLEAAIDEHVMSDVRAITSWLPEKAKERVLAKFAVELRSQIAMNRKNKRFTKT